jgi:Uma2 family endonuclease
MTVEQYEAMVAAGVLTKRDRVHLINGYLVAKMTQKPPHVTADDLLGAELTRNVRSDRYYIRPAKPIRLPARASEPEPDRCVVRGTARDYEQRHPGPDDIALVAEVADSSLPQDRKLAEEVYGPAGIPVYWIVDLVHRQVEVYTDPGPEGYRSRAVFAEGQSVPVVIDGQQIGEIAVADILPSRPVRPTEEGNGAAPEGDTR